MDEHVPLAVTTGLRRRGVDVSIALDAGLISVQDQEQLSHAFQSGRVMVTHDDDYLRLHASGVLHAGIAYCHQESLTVGELILRLMLIYDVMTAEEMYGRVEFL
jgi:hypothetical protein